MTGVVTGGPPSVGEQRERAAAALRRLGHALIAHECEPDLLERIAALSDRTAAEVETMTSRARPIAIIKRQLWETAPADGEPMSHYPECVVSGKANPMGIAMSPRRVGDEVIADVRLGAAFEGAPQRAHGGVIAAIFDDIMGYVLTLLRQPAYTGQLTVRYRAPVPIGDDLSVRAWLQRRDGRKLWLAAQLHNAGTLLGDAEALFIAIPPERLGVGEA